jgi:hypothetical protein
MTPRIARLASDSLGGVWLEQTPEEMPRQKFFFLKSLLPWHSLVYGFGNCVD